MNKLWRFGTILHFTTECGIEEIKLYVAHIVIYRAVIFICLNATVICSVTYILLQNTFYVWVTRGKAIYGWKHLKDKKLYLTYNIYISCKKTNVCASWRSLFIDIWWISVQCFHFKTYHKLPGCRRCRLLHCFSSFLLFLFFILAFSITCLNEDLRRLYHKIDILCQQLSSSRLGTLRPEHAQESLVTP